MKFPHDVTIVSGQDTIRQLIQKQTDKQRHEDAFFLSDLGQVVEQYLQWQSLCPTVEPYYAVKCNNDPAILQTLALLGTGFDCASRAEMEQVLKLGVSPERIIFANPCKMKSHVEFAREKKVAMMTFDDEHELEKIKKIYPEAKLVLRILPPPTKAVCDLGCKYGVQPDKVPALLSRAKQWDLNIIGVSFHVGSGCLEADAFSKAISVCRTVFREAEELGLNLELLDIGGGFPGHDAGDVSLKEISEQINCSLEKYFPQSSGVRVISEPGRYFASAACTLATNVIGKRDRMYYINDGVYGSFNCILYDHATVEVNILKSCSDVDERYESSVWGPTCDGLDCVLPSVSLPNISTGDWLYFNNMGAYTSTAGSTFNGMPRPRVYYVIQEELWQKLQELSGEQEEEEEEEAEVEEEFGKGCEEVFEEGFTAYNHRKDFTMENIYTEIF